MCTFAWLYGDGSSAAGVLLSAPIELGGSEANSTFGGIIRCVRGSLMKQAGSTGAWGFGFDVCLSLSRVSCTATPSVSQSH